MDVAIAGTVPGHAYSQKLAFMFLTSLIAIPGLHLLYPRILGSCRLPSLQEPSGRSMVIHILE